MDKEILTSEALAALLSAYPEWSVVDGKLHRAWRFGYYRAAFSFLREAAFLFERQNHHGDATLSYRHVRIVLTSHDVGGLTARDVRSVKSLEEISTEEVG